MVQHYGETPPSFCNSWATAILQVDIPYIPAHMPRSISKVWFRAGGTGPAAPVLAGPIFSTVAKIFY